MCAADQPMLQLLDEVRLLHACLLLTSSKPQLSSARLQSWLRRMIMQDRPWYKVLTWVAHLLG